VTIFPLITLVVVATAPLLGRLALVRLAVTTGVTVPLMTWVVMPRVTRLLGDGWTPTGANDPADVRPRRFPMLGNYPVDVVLLATDLGVARRFHEATLGLEVLVADEQFLTFGGGGDRRLLITKSTSGTREAVTKASWRVADLAGEVAWLRARGVPVQEVPELGTVEGIADLSFALAAWFVDPDHHWIGLLQLNDPAVGPAAPPSAPGRPTARTPGPETEGPAARNHRTREDRYARK
jgi:hypothetical protein